MLSRREILGYEFPEHLAGALCCGDAEANGLLEDKKELVEKQLVIHPACTKIWMVCHKIPDTGECWDFINDFYYRKHYDEIVEHNKSYNRTDVNVLPLSLLPKFYDLCGRQVFHNGHKFDFPAIEKFLKYVLPVEKRWDTLIQSQTQDCDRDYVFGSTSGPHSLESWAIRVGNGYKVEHEDWMNFSLAMYRRCWRDTEIQCDVYQALMEEKEQHLEDYNINWDRALKTEQEVAYWIGYSEFYGFPIDKEFATKLVSKLDESCESIAEKLLPNMPYRLYYDTGCGTKVNWEKYVEAMLKNTDLTRIPIGWCWEEDGPNRPTPIWDPFKKNGEPNQHVVNFWNGKDAESAKPAEPERLAKPAVLDENGKILEKAVRAKKAVPAKEAKPRKPNAYEDDAGVCHPPIHKCTVEDVAGPFTRIQWNHYNLGSNNQVLEYLQRYTTWEPTEYTEKGNPKLTEDSYESIGVDSDLGENLKNYLIDRSRRTNILNFKDPTKGWMNKIRPDGRVTPINHTMGTPTARSRHAGIVNVPSGGARWGHEMRSCWTAYESGLMIGSDASGLEMRALAHEMGDPETTAEIVEGDIHSVIWELIDDFSASRSDTKPIEYALIYGASDPKLGSLATVDGCREVHASEAKLRARGWVQDSSGLWRHKQWNPKKDSLTFKEAQDTVCGAIIRKRIMEGLKPLGDCIERITKQAEKGYLVGLDGRMLKVRSTHSALNLRLQSLGAIVMKTGLVTLMKKIDALGLFRRIPDYGDGKFVQLFTFYHDEYQLGIPEELVEDRKTLTFNICDKFDISNKKQKKAAKEYVKEKIVGRFAQRERRLRNKIWSAPVIDLEAGTAKICYSKIGQLCVETFEETGREFNLSCPITGDYMVGRNWGETH